MRNSKPTFVREIYFGNDVPESVLAETLDDILPGENHEEDDKDDELGEALKDHDGDE